MRRGTFMRIGVLAIGLGVLAAGVKIWFFPAPRYNLILVTLDTTRADRIGCYGHTGAWTPTLDALAQRGVLFERAYTIAPLTLPAHASIHTGLYPAEHGLLTNGRNRLGESIPTLAELLAGRGYATGAFVASFVLNNRFGLNRGFQTYGDRLAGGDISSHNAYPQRSADLVLDEALPWLTAQARKPFFCWIHLYDPHHPYLAHKDEFGDEFVNRPYDAEIAFVDRQLQRLVAFVNNSRLDERTMIVIVGDHGEGLQDHAETGHGYMLYNSTIHVPFIALFPEQTRRGLRVIDPVSLIDLCPTILDCLGVRPPAHLSGRTLRPALLGEPLEPRACYAATDEPFLAEGWSPLRSLITPDWKYVSTAKPELYDLRADPEETHNLAAAQPEKRAEMHQLLVALQSKQIPRQGESVKLSAQEEQVLKSLGYLGGKNPEDSWTPEQARPDIKDMLGALNGYLQAQELLEGGATDAAIQRLREVVDASATYVAPRLLLAQVLAAQGERDDAIELYESILKADPGHRDANARLGYLYVTQQSYDDALPLLLRALESDSNSAELHYDLGALLELMGRPDEAAPYFDEAARLAPDFVPARIKIGARLLAAGQVGPAITQYEAAVRADSQSAPAHYGLARAYSANNRDSESIGQLIQTLELDPANPAVHYDLAVTLSRQQRTPEAIEHLTEALRLDPRHAPARELLRNLPRDKSNQPGKARSGQNPAH